VVMVRKKEDDGKVYAMKILKKEMVREGLPCHAIGMVAVTGRPSRTM